MINSRSVSYFFFWWSQVVSKQDSCKIRCHPNSFEVGQNHPWGGHLVCWEAQDDTLLSNSRMRWVALGILSLDICVSTLAWSNWTFFLEGDCPSFLTMVHDWRVLQLDVNWCKIDTTCKSVTSDPRFFELSNHSIQSSIFHLKNRGYVPQYTFVPILRQGMHSLHVDEAAMNFLCILYALAFWQKSLAKLSLRECGRPGHYSFITAGARSISSNLRISWWRSLSQP